MTISEDQTERALNTVKNTLDEIKNRPHRQQVVIGVGSGLLAGYIFTKIGRAAALLLGGSLIALQILKTIEENRVFFGSFGGGFLIAVSVY